MGGCEATCPVNRRFPLEKGFFGEGGLQSGLLGLPIVVIGLGVPVIVVHGKTQLIQMVSIINIGQQIN